MAPSEKQEFIQEIAKYAQKHARKSGVLPSLTIAQAILESNWGKSTLSRDNKNLFGIKGPGETYQTKEFINGKWITVAANFRTYDTFEGSVRDHNAMLKRMKRYAAVIGEKDYKKACHAIWKAGYATDPDYPQKLIAIIESFELNKYDQLPEPKKKHAISKPDAEKIIDMIQARWGQAETKEEKDELHRLANVIRAASGIKTP